MERSVVGVLTPLMVTLPLAWQIANVAGWVSWEVTGIFENIGVVQEGMETIAVPHTLMDRPGARELELPGAVLAVGADGGGGGFAPPPAQSQLGTSYGESQYSVVQEVEFKRHRKRKPDAILIAPTDKQQLIAPLQQAVDAVASSHAGLGLVDPGAGFATLCLLLAAAGRWLALRRRAF